MPISATLVTRLTVKNSKFRKSKMATAAILKNPKTPYLGHGSSNLMKFGTLMQSRLLDRPDR